MAASTCCKKGGASDCVCAEKATCSCGKRSALHCDCDKSAAENNTAGPRCSCGQRPAGACTCETVGAASANETDFTTRK